MPSVSQAVRASGSEGETRMGGFLAARILDAFSGEGSEGRVRPVKNFRPERAFTSGVGGDDPVLLGPFSPSNEWPNGQRATTLTSAPALIYPA